MVRVSRITTHYSRPLNAWHAIHEQQKTITDPNKSIDSPRGKPRGIIDLLFILFVLANPEVELRGMRSRNSNPAPHYGGLVPPLHTSWL